MYERMTENLGGLSFAFGRGMLGAAGLVSGSTLTWIISRTQGDMSVRVEVQLGAGLLALLLAAPAAALARKAGGAALVALLLLLSCPMPLCMTHVVSSGNAPIWWILTYAMCLALVDAFSIPAQEAFQNQLIPAGPSRLYMKQAAPKVRNCVNYLGRITMWILLAAGAVSLRGVNAARTTYFVEALLLVSLALAVAPLSLFAAQRSARSISPVKPEAASRAGGGGEGESMMSIFLLEFALNGFFIGALMLPRILPDNSLTTYNWVLALGGLGSLIGASLARPRKEWLWCFVALDLGALTATYAMRGTAAIAAGWFTASLCYGTLDTIFSRVVLTGAKERSANLASLRRLLMTGVRAFTMFAIIKFQTRMGLSEREIVYVSISLSAFLASLCWIKRSSINWALARATAA